MTSRAYAFPRIDVRESPRRESSPIGTYAADWAAARARAATVKALPSNPPMPAHTATANGLAEVVGERRRKGEVFEA